MNREDPRPLSERETLELLPWYVNDTLDGAERERVKQELRSSLTCRLEYERLARLQSRMRADDAERVAEDRGFERLMARIHAGDSPRAAAASPARSWLPLAQAAAVLALAAGIAWWGIGPSARAPAAYRTLTTEEPPAIRSAQLRLEFAPGLSGAERAAFLAQQGLAMAAPATADGIYTVRLPEGADARAIADRLRADPRVAFVATPAANEPR